MNCLISSSCDPSNEKLDACDHKPSLCTGDGGFEILGEPAIVTEPGEGALHHPSPGQELEALRGIGTLDDLQRPLAKLLQRLLELRSGIGTVGDDMAQPGKRRADRSRQQRRAVAVLNVGAMNSWR